MDRKTEAYIRRLTLEVADECGMNTAIKQDVDKVQEHTKELAEFILKKTALSTANRLTIAENDKLAAQMKMILDQKINKITRIDEKKQIEYDKMLEARINRAIKRGDIPDPSKDPFIREMMGRMQK